MKKCAWITWEKQQRNRSMSQALNCELYEITDHKGLKRYIISIFKTLLIFIKERPRIIYAQNPSIILAFIAIWYGKITNTLIVIDAHNAGIKPFEGMKHWANLLANYVIRTAPLTIVTNRLLANIVLEKKGRPAILPDPLPDIRCTDDDGYLLPPQDLNVFCISSWAADEPYLEVMKAAELINRNINIYISGNSKGKEKKIGRKLPNNVILTGYLDDNGYRKALCSSNIVMVLTTRTDCMVCGAYEAIAAEKILILSDTPVLRDYFGDIAIYTKNKADSIAAAIHNIALKRSNYRTISGIAAKNKIVRQWLLHKQELDRILATFSEKN